MATTEGESAIAEVEELLARHPEVADVHVARFSDAGLEATVAYVVPRHPWPANDVVLGRPSLVREWSEFFDVVGGTSDPADVRFDTAGWERDHTGERLPAEDLVDWVVSTVDRLRCLGGSDVLELGCGVGNLVWHLAPQADRYVATEISPLTASLLERRLRAEGVDNVDVLRRDASDFDGFVAESFDLVIVNSTVQYFPSQRYLEDVLDRALRVLRPGGHLYVGDVRSRATHDLWAAYAALGADPASVSPVWAPWLVNRLRATERELLLDPRFFVAWGQRRPDLERVSVMPRRGRRWSEMTRFRYDVVMRKQAPVRSRARREPAPISLTWNDVGGNVERLLHHLAMQSPQALRVCGVPNSRVADAVAVWAAAAPDERSGTGDPRAVDPEDLWQLARVTDYDVELSQATGDPLGAFDAIFRRRGPTPSTAETIDARTCVYRDLMPGDYVEEPLAAADALRPARELAVRLRRGLAAAGSEGPVPDAFVTVDAIPRKASGGVDRTDLAVGPSCARPPTCGPYVPPCGPLEAQLCEIWGRTLLLERVGTADDFFELGGHGFFARQMLWAIGDATGIEIPLATFRDDPCVAGLARAIVRDPTPFTAPPDEADGGRSRGDARRPGPSGAEVAELAAARLADQLRLTN